MVGLGTMMEFSETLDRIIYSSFFTQLPISSLSRTSPAATQLRLSCCRFQLTTPTTPFTSFAQRSYSQKPSLLNTSNQTQKIPETKSSKPILKVNPQRQFLKASSQIQSSKPTPSKKETSTPISPSTKIKQSPCPHLHAPTPTSSPHHPAATAPTPQLR